MMTRIMNAHEPALTAQEAAMLPAIPAVGNPGRLLMPQDTSAFRPVEEAAAVQNTAQEAGGSVAGRAVLGRITLPGVGRMRSGKRQRPQAQEPDVVPVEWYL